ncbi:MULTISPECIES: hypothetical protein [unclassified Nocardia]|uniref:hypothetical protein n=1 Tax=unclassified Nocardia TaxID=2637762 RepID=UPI0033B7976D
MAEEPQRNAHGEPMVTSTAAYLDALRLPPDAHLTESIRVFLRAAVSEPGADDLQTMSAMALGPLLIAVGRLEVDLADARTRVAELERALGRRDGHR